MYGDTTKLAAALPPKMTAERTTYYRLKYRVILLFGLTELKAQISWVEDISSIAVYDHLTHPLIQGIEKRYS